MEGWLGFSSCLSTIPPEQGGRMPRPGAKRHTAECAGSGGEKKTSVTHTTITHPPENSNARSGMPPGIHQHVASHASDHATFHKNTHSNITQHMALCIFFGWVSVGFHDPKTKIIK